MKKSILILIAITFSLCFDSIGQDKEEKKFGIKFSGFVKSDFIFDTRQVVSAREGHFLLYPKNVRLDREGEDINAKSSFNYLSIQSRLTGKISGPDAFGAKTSGVIEGAFFGHIETSINSFRLRHAFIKLNWKTTEFLFGQYWHSMFVTQCFPGTVSFNTGTPFQFFSRNPQIRLTQKIGAITISGMAATQLDFVSPGGSKTIRNSLLPDLQGQISWSNSKLLIGVTAGYKRLLPRLETDSLYKASSKIGGVTGQAFFKLTTSPITFKMQATYLQNGFDGLAIGGYAVQSITNPARDYRSYTTINTMSFWADIHTNSKKLQVGLFIGYSKNMGSDNEIEEMGLYGRYSRGSDIAYLYRVSPRLIVNRGKIRVATEIEHTAAAYGSSIDTKGIPQDDEIVINNRVLVAVYYFF